jgi:N-acetyl-anhydromuramyl-L-alanine amidase AmpD
MSVRQMLVPSSNYKYKCPNKMTPEYITVHNTANDASAENEIRYMIHNTNQTSYHFAVDDKEVIQGVALDRNAWHAGDGNGNGNRKSIGVEICYSKSGGERYKKAEANAVNLIAQLLKERNWGIDRVKKHQDWSGKNCPHRILDEGRWNQFLNAIAEELKPKEVPTNEIRHIYTGGYAGPALLNIHNYLVHKGHGYDVKRGKDGSIIFLIGPFDTGVANFKECSASISKFDSNFKILTREQAAEWRK